MGKIIYGIVLVVLMGLVLYPTHNTKNPNTPQQFAEKEPQPISDTHPEITAKQALIDEDVRITEELSRSHNLNAAAEQLKLMQTDQTPSEASLLAKVSAWLAKQHNFIYLQYGGIPQQGNPTPKHHYGEVSPQVLTMAGEYLEEANKAIKSSKSYTSPRFQVDNRSYFVFGQRSADGKHYMAGIVNQDVLQNVKDHQITNMRLKPFHSENKPNIKTVEPGTLKAKSTQNNQNNQANQANQDNQESNHYERNQVVVKFRKPPSTTDLGQILSQINGAVLQKFDKTIVFRSNTMDAQALIHYFRKWNVEYAEPHYLYMTNSREAFIKPILRKNNTSQTQQTFTPNDNLYSRYQWNLRQIGTEQSWALSPNAKDVLVAVVDTGVDLTHPDMKEHLVKGYNVIKPEADPEDDVGHGTHVAGVISAIVNNHLGIAGMTPTSRVLPVKVLDETGAGSTYAVALGIIWATDHGAKVINMSLGNYATSNFLHDAIRYAYDHDVVLIAASGNDNTNRPSYPAYYPEVFAVSASDSSNQRASFSNYGEYIDVAAPGVNIPSTYLKHQYVSLSGTSMASPHVSALAALIRATNPNLRNTEVMDIMRKTAQDIGEPGTDLDFGYGLINVPKAVEAAIQYSK